MCLGTLRGCSTSRFTEIKYVIEMEFNESNCANETVEQDDALSTTTVIKIASLALIDIAVVMGNSLVIAAVITTRNLRTVTNIFIVSLACADLALGFAVLPFSITHEGLKVWIWGQSWCNIWLAIDVWLCTASILSLCAISLDRYVAVTHPMRYPTLMCPRRGRVLVSCVWILSFVICLPPLLGWNDGGADIKADSIEDSDALPNRTALIMDKTYNSPWRFLEEVYVNFTGDDYQNDGIYSNMSLFINLTQCYKEMLTCELTLTVGYRIYASLGSFFIPMLVMVFFYFRIYMTAVRTASSMRKGVLTTRTSHELAPLNGAIIEEEIQLRVHRGGISTLSHHKSSRISEKVSSPNDQHTEGSTLPKSRLGANSTFAHQNTNRRVYVNNHCRKQIIKHLHGFTMSEHILRSFNHHENNDNKQYEYVEDLTELEILDTNGTLEPVTLSEAEDKTNRSPFGSRRCKLLIKEGKADNAKRHARKFRREAKAAKTLAIIVGAFIVCWLPFFTIYLLGAFCQGCVSDIVFSVFFWLGYCNSALNPCIYAMFAKDFRFAFKRIMCCTRRKGFTQAARADYVTGTRHRLTLPIKENESTSDY